MTRPWRDDDKADGDASDRDDGTDPASLAAARYWRLWMANWKPPFEAEAPWRDAPSAEADPRRGEAT